MTHCHSGLARHRTEEDGTGVEFLDHSARWTRGLSLGELLEFDRVDADEARRIAREQYGVELG